MSTATHRPGVSVIIRSFNRLEACAELVEAILAQDYPDFEVIVVEQSTKGTDTQRARLDALADADARLRVLKTPPLGPPGARNAGWKAARKEIILFIDDDDLPVGDQWIQLHADCYDDPDVIGVSGREVHALDEECGYKHRHHARARCLSYNFFGYPHVYCRFDERVEPVQWLHGGNASARREHIAAVDGWDTDVRDHEEHSFAFKLRRHLKSGQRLIFDPRPTMLRRNWIAGGLERRVTTTRTIFNHHFSYFHRIYARYHLGRFLRLYPAYPGLITGLTVRWIWKDSHRHTKLHQRLGATLGVLASAPVWFTDAYVHLLRDALTRCNEEGDGVLESSPTTC